MIEHNIGGKNFYRVGGKYVPVPKYDGGGDIESGRNAMAGIRNTFNNVLGTGNKDNTYGDFQGGSQTPNKWYNSPSTWGTALDLGAGFAKTLGAKKQPGLSARANAISKQYNDPNYINTIGGAGLGIAAMVDPTGISKLIDSGVKLGKGAKSLINPGNEYGVSTNSVAEVAGNMLDPLGRLQQSFTTGMKHGIGEGIKDFATFGVSGNNLQKKAVKEGLNADKKDDMQMRQGMNQGAYRNDSVYAREGAHVKPNYKNDLEKNVEIEDGEIVLGNPTTIDMTGNATTSLESKYGAMFHGDKHGQDTDGDGQEGIPLRSGEAYVASDYLGVNGKRAGKGNKSVAQEMKPNLAYLSSAEKNKLDPYSNNPIAIAEMNRQMHAIKRDAERNKFMEEVSKMSKKKDRNMNELLSFVTENAPKEDMSPDELNQLNNITNSVTNQNQNQMYNQMYSQRQQGGPVSPEQNISGQEFSDLVAQSPSIDPSQPQPGMPQPGMPQEGGPEGQGGQLSPEAQQMLQQFPPEIQEQIMQLPPEQQEQAIMEFAQQQGMGGEQGAPQGPPQGGDPAAMGGDPAAMGGDPAAMGAPEEMMGAPEMGTDPSGQPVMRCGGKIYRRGDYIKFQKGGQVYSGNINNINPYNNNFSLG